jgi:uncharacterized protein involved in oxidation of intracellular sulfur
MNVLIILQGPAYGTEGAYNGLRLATNLSARAGVTVKVFCFGDAVSCAITNQKLPDGYYHLDRMLTSAAHHGVEIGLCGSCMDARGITTGMIIPDAHKSNLDQVSDWTLWADKTLTF